LRTECVRIGGATVAEVEDARVKLDDPGCPRLSVYGVAALLETFYTGVEKALRRIAASMGGMPDGASWHRQLLHDAELELPKLRPAVLDHQTVRALDPYLAFRYRFRNLYLFDLDAALMVPLVTGIKGVWAQTERDLLAFAQRLEQLAERVG
jgi:hypothetical protein